MKSSKIEVVDLFETHSRLSTILLNKQVTSELQYFLTNAWLLTAIISRSDCQLLGNKLSFCTMFHAYFI